MLLLSSVFALIMGVAVIFIRIKASEKPVNAKKILLPPVFMSTGALMYIFPYFRISPFEIAEAVIAGALFSIFLIKTSSFEVKEGEIFLKRSKAFAIVIIALLLIRLALKVFFSSSTTAGELGGMFWLIAFCMLVPWRVTMYLQFRKLESSLQIKAETI
ncbi:membrane protein CcdC involved in cytochrome C biogenesis [Bacillus oleivorans]|uniref:Membrane protein CcdC involved in cytochrome C biogenesis n=1 Tax=Bacillus oleivorans TaxID=1448271 RepID=A0A285D6L6_9BACI|nr:cytochrome c biogenesis protein CcdC [Bacillus oleivorans]SNX75449.1 membrane protein CcdC involved in cytochrome C biogenesis [Bacillus oleivorans]